MVELENGHQFKCKVMKNLMKEIRDSGLLEENRKLLNTRVIDEKNVKCQIQKQQDLPHSIMTSAAR